MDLWYTSRAETDLEEIGDYIAQDNPARALAFKGSERSARKSVSRPWPIAHVPNSETRFAHPRLVIT